MDPAEIKSSLKSALGAKIFLRKIVPSPVLWEPFNVTALSRTAVAFGNKFPTAHTDLSAVFGNCSQWRSEL